MPWPVVLIDWNGISKNINFTKVKDCFRMRMTLIFLASFGCPASQDKKEFQPIRGRYSILATDADGEKWLAALPN